MSLLIAAAALYSRGAASTPDAASAPDAAEPAMNTETTPDPEAQARQKELAAVYELPKKVEAPVAAGQPLGMLRYVAGNETVASVPICAAESVERVGVGELWVRLAAALCGRTNTQ